ncbi:TACR2 [Branchiostoma lanceolatum]|uniref:TACR2 protein n=2 Tax=Branchiostoma lanceolatum TaxID=7740 RepID=A0A8J9YVY5_BRALA|nr:TACR2 [Branchiostoma lanceolatum]
MINGTLYSSDPSQFDLFDSLNQQLNIFPGISITSSVVMLTVIAIDRFYAIIFPLKARITETNTAAVISTVWLISCAVNVPLLVVSEQKQWQWDDGVLEIWCAEKWDQHQKAIYTSVLFVVLYAIPLVVMMVAYFLLARKLWRTTSPGIAALSIQQLQLKAKKKVIKMLVVVMTVFFVCWTPYHVLQIWLQFGTLPKESPPYFKQLRFVVLLLGYSNSAMNPIIYAGVNENFRKSFWDAYKCKHCRRNQVQPDGPAVWLEHPHENIETHSTQAPQELRIQAQNTARA